MSSTTNVYLNTSANIVNAEEYTQYLKSLGFQKGRVKPLEETPLSKLKHEGTKVSLFVGVMLGEGGSVLCSLSPTALRKYAFCSIDKYYILKEDAIDNVYTSNNRCGTIHKRHATGIITAANGNRYMNRDTIEAAGYTERNGAWVLVDRSKLLFGYHSGKRKNLSKSDAIYRIGFEVEKEDDGVKSWEEAMSLWSREAWAKESDGSLGAGGFELVSPTFGLYPDNDTLNAPIYTSFERMEQYLNAKFTSNCGGHINISKNDMEAKEFFRNEIAGYMPLLYAMYPKRLSNTYSQAKSKNNYCYGDKYQAANLKGGGVLELRIFPAVRSKDNLLWRLELIQIMLRNPSGDAKTVLSYLVDDTHALHEHLLKIYTVDQLKKRVKSFVEHSRTYDNANITKLEETSAVDRIKEKPSKVVFSATEEV